MPDTNSVNDPIDLDEGATWPEATRRWAHEHAGRLAGSTQWLADLAISLEQEDEFRQTFGARKLIAYHNTRLLPHEAQAIRAGGLRLLDEQLVRDRISNAVARGALSHAARREAETGNIYAIRNVEGRASRICLVIGRSTFDEDPGGCDSLLRYWGGEAIRGGPGEVPELATIGTPSIVVAQLGLTRRHDDPYSYPLLAKLFVGLLLRLEGCYGELHYAEPVAGADVLAIWQPGDREYDCHRELPQ
jgi:hypothetical protein